MTPVSFFSTLRFILAKHLQNKICFLHDSLFKVILSTKIKEPAPKKVLVLRLDAIGDFILWINSAKALRELYPSPVWNLTLVVNSLCVPFAEALNIFDEIIAVDKRQFIRTLSYRRMILRRINRETYAHAIHPAVSREFSYGDSLMRFVKAERKTGWQADATVDLRIWLKIGNRYYRELFPQCAEEEFEGNKNSVFVERLGGTPTHSMPDIPSMGKLPEELNALNYFVLFPGASVGRKQWPVDRFAEIADRIYEHTGWTAVLCGSKAEIPIAEKINARIKKAEVKIFSGKTSLPDLVAVVRRARLLLTNDTASVHIAAGTGIRAICILGGGHFGRFLPYPAGVDTLKNIRCASYHMSCYGCNWICKYQFSKSYPAPCISNVTVERVWGEVLKIV